MDVVQACDRSRAGKEWFVTTRWSTILQAGQEDCAAKVEALEKLCRTYWYTLYAYVRRKGYTPPDAQDLTQEFFSRLLAGNCLATVDRRKGKFRSFLVASLEHFLAKEWARAGRLKRGGGCTLVSLDAAEAEGRYIMEPADPLSPEKIYERRWALTLLDQAMGCLRDECQEQGKEELFQQVKGSLSDGKSEQGYAVIAASLGMSKGAVKVAVHRLRQRFGELLRAEIAQTLANPNEVEQEVRYLCAALAE